MGTAASAVTVVVAVAVTVTVLWAFGACSPVTLLPQPISNSPVTIENTPPSTVAARVPTTPMTAAFTFESVPPVCVWLCCGAGALSLFTL